MDKHNVVCVYNGILVGLKKEGNADPRYNVSLEDVRLSEISQPHKEKDFVISLSQLPTVVKCTETESRMVVTWHRGGLALWGQSVVFSWSREFCG